MKIVAIIPARMGSSRFPGKPLAPLLGRSMLEHVYRRVTMCKALTQTLIATCDEEIRMVAEDFGAQVVMTGKHHERATDRIAEAALEIDADVFVMVQGDEPMVVPEQIELAIQPYVSGKNPPACVNLSKRIANESELGNPNTIKVVTDLSGRALFMSRQAIPTLAKKGLADSPAFKQVCIIPFTRKALLEYAQLIPTPLEELESIDMLRFLEHGHTVQMIETFIDTQAVDTPEDLALVSEMMKNDELCRLY